MESRRKKQLYNSLTRLFSTSLSPLDLLPHTDFREKCIDLVHNGIPGNVDQATLNNFYELRQYLTHGRTDTVRVVVFGGGTGLSNIIGGDSRQQSWHNDPFAGLKEVFPETRSIVCVTDDGGSTGEMIKDLPLIALGDIRHVLLSSIQLRILQKKYSLSLTESRGVAEGLAAVLNKRYPEGGLSEQEMVDLCLRQQHRLPTEITEFLLRLVYNLTSDSRLVKPLKRAHCLGNLLIASAIYTHIPAEYDNIQLERQQQIVSRALFQGIEDISQVIGTTNYSVMPSTTTPARLRFCYSNGVEVTGEDKSSEALRGFAVDRAVVDFADEVHVPDQVCREIDAADIIILAPGSLYSSIIPVFQVPGIAECVRRNSRAQKLLISNLWVQTGETDIALSDPERKFHISDMIKAYEDNIPGGTAGLFHEVLCLSLKDVPASILQNYALEGKIPIYLDKQIVYNKGYIPVECGIYSKKSLAERDVIQHDPELLASAVRTVYQSSRLLKEKQGSGKVEHSVRPHTVAGMSISAGRRIQYPSEKFRQIEGFIASLPIQATSHSLTGDQFASIKDDIIDIIWQHQDISMDHLRMVKGILCVENRKWPRQQVWDKVYSFYDPEDGFVKIRSDQLFNSSRLEVAFLIALGQSLLGDYALQKHMEDVLVDGNVVGKVYHLTLREADKISCYFNEEDLGRYLELARMVRFRENSRHYTRLINGTEGFTPPGVLMGLTFAWYLDNRLASHIEYKMALMKIQNSDLIPEQLKMLNRRHDIVNFFREKVFR